ncbi:MAG: hypothetical protein E7612_08080 [Ruminococcaceae bacterium]|nr:hypothetical protein [Oscillospiraceae bacterium]
MYKLKRKATTVVIVFLIITIISSAIAITVRLNTPEEEAPIVNDFGYIKGSIPSGGIYKDRALNFQYGYCGDADFHNDYVGSSFLKVVSEYNNDYLRYSLNGISSSSRFGLEISRDEKLEPLLYDDVLKYSSEIYGTYDRSVFEFDLKIDSVGDITLGGNNFLDIRFGRTLDKSGQLLHFRLYKSNNPNYFSIDNLSTLVGNSDPMLKYGTWYNFRLELFDYIAPGAEGDSACLIYVDNEFVGWCSITSDHLGYVAKYVSIVPRSGCTDLVVGIDNVFSGYSNESIYFNESE